MSTRETNDSDSEQIFEDQAPLKQHPVIVEVFAPEMHEEARLRLAFHQAPALPNVGDSLQLGCLIEHSGELSDWIVEKRVFVYMCTETLFDRKSEAQINRQVVRIYTKV